MSSMLPLGTVGCTGVRDLRVAATQSGSQQAVSIAASGHNGENTPETNYNTVGF